MPVDSECRNFKAEVSEPGRLRATRFGETAFACQTFASWNQIGGWLRDYVLKSTPLGWACRWGRAELVKLYLERGADPVEPDAEAWATPLAWAKKMGHSQIEEYLRRAGARQS